MDENTMILYRCGEPSKQDIAPFGSVCIVKNTTKSDVLLYIQLSHHDQDPTWNYIGNFDADISNEQLLFEKKKILYPTS